MRARVPLGLVVGLGERLEIWFGGHFAGGAHLQDPAAYRAVAFMPLFFHHPDQGRLKYLVHLAALGRAQGEEALCVELQRTFGRGQGRYEIGYGLPGVEVDDAFAECADLFAAADALLFRAARQSG